MPRRIGRAGFLYHFIHGRFIGIPFFPVSPVFIGDLPLFFRCVLPFVKAFQLCFLINMNPEFDKHSAPVHQFLFEFVYFIIGSLPVVGTAEALNPFHHNPSVPCAVKNGYMAGFRQPCPETPEIMPGLFMGLRTGDGVDFKAPGIQRSGNPLDISPFSCGIPAFIGNNQRNSFTVKSVVKLTQPFLKLIQFLLVFRLLHSFIQRDFINLGIFSRGKVFCSRGTARLLF